MKKVMLTRLLSKKGVCSRKEAVQFIKTGRVRVGNRVIKDPFVFVFEDEKLYLDDSLVKVIKKVYFVLNKPEGYVVSNKDDLGRKTVLDLIKFKGHLFAVGRLDIDVSGLLILTNDTQLCEGVLDPSEKVIKKYHVKIDRGLSKVEVKKLKSGVLIGKHKTKPAFVRIINFDPKNYWIELGICEGKFHQVKKMVTKLGAKVLDLNRVSIGGLHMSGLKKGEFKKISEEEIYMRLFCSKKS